MKNHLTLVDIANRLATKHRFPSNSPVLSRREFESLDIPAFWPTVGNSSLGECLAAWLEWTCTRPDWLDVHVFKYTVSGNIAIITMTDANGANIPVYSVISLNVA